jgi:hypothetical protein
VPEAPYLLGVIGLLARDGAFRGQFRHTPRSLLSNDAEPNELVVIADTKAQSGSPIEIRSMN